MRADEVAETLGGAIVRRRERKSGITRETFRAPGWQFVDCKRCGKAISANSHRAPRGLKFCSKHATDSREYETIIYPVASEARRHMIAALRTYKALEKRKRLDREIVWGRFQKELGDEKC